MLVAIVDVPPKAGTGIGGIGLRGFAGSCGGIFANGPLSLSMDGQNWIPAGRAMFTS